MVSHCIARLAVTDVQLDDSDEEVPACCDVSVYRSLFVPLVFLSVSLNLLWVPSPPPPQMPPSPSRWLMILDRISSGSLANALSEGSLCWRHFLKWFFSAKRSQGCRFWSQLVIFPTPFSQTFRQVCVCVCVPGCTLLLWLVLSPGTWISLVFVLWLFKGEMIWNLILLCLH